ncbi:FeoB-associated Cys-rich membrane protein [Planctomicrobium sp. SH668]|uniref:FeoB-associated Cys-rich membrane protein n=1 Tax=Planctomicrobium sp. SH668 TaxID=3448126 RepID=UPI003F5BE324
MDWQSLIVLLFVLLASAMMLRRIWALFQGKPSQCGGGCSSCPSNKSNAADTQFVTLQGIPGRDRSVEL